MHKLKCINPLLQWVARGLRVGLPLLFCLAVAAPDYDKLVALAQQRHGERAAQTVQAWRLMVEQARAQPEAQRVETVNQFFNRRVAFEDDIVVWQQNDYWATPLEFMGRGAGDCEDFTIAKYLTLQILGVDDARLRLIYVRANTGTTSVAHMVLGFYPQPTAEPLILDNLITSIRPASSRPDLMPLFSFNGAGLWVGNAAASSGDPTARLSRWRDLLERMRRDGLVP